jgi:hypothetical protein
MKTSNLNHNLLLKKIKQGMEVYDSTGDKVGTVEFIHFSEAGDSQSTQAASLPDLPTEADLVAILGRLFGSDNLPEEMRERLRMQGFIKVDSANLFGADRYVLPDQIANVTENVVYLCVKDSEELLKR